MPADVEALPVKRELNEDTWSEFVDSSMIEYSPPGRDDWLLYIKRLPIRETMGIIKKLGAGSGAEEQTNIDAMLELAVKCVCRSNGDPAFTSIDTVERALSVCLVDLSQHMLAAQGLAAQPEKKV
jgi:hypothetical protein